MTKRVEYMNVDSTHFNKEHWYGNNYSKKEQYDARM